MEGIIVRGVGGFYYVQSDGIEYECRARGNFRVEGITPLVGDHVRFEAQSGQTGYVLEVLPRKNALKRPPVANVDQLAIVLAPTKPKPHFLLIDKLLLHARLLCITPLLCINKTDLDPQGADAIAEEYGAACATVQTSALNGAGTDDLARLLQGKITCFAGQSAVGKSSLLNALCPGAQLQTGALSRKTQRGKQTTRHSSLLPFGTGGYVVDTPGFSLFELPLSQPEEIAAHYPEMEPYLGQCAFSSCLHLSEPDCAVKARSNISAGRYERYAQLVGEFIEMKEKMYD